MGDPKSVQQNIDERRIAAQDLIESFLNSIADQNREPDAWEARDILASMSAMLGKMHFLSRIYIERAGVPPDGRADRWSRNEETPTLEALRRTFEVVKGYP
jgi:hypothetical protein